ncbi:MULTISPECIES: hypothetical protein [unclassified Ensifer]|uniref:hypothetical protein n=1 Tax=unclassified Ensifer TaxID=2633371 RepID=UPI000813097F|nr:MULTISPECIES: hypothetical protein [unclassified Ensifer]OCP23172.1 hypothetical protein BC361_23435 [Ensifer sp. LC54]OCP25000.1 hypothetical protein BC363_21615 [Ensifer sp. LC384]
MNPLLIDQGLKWVGRKLGKSMFNDTLNGPEAYADRIAQDFGNEWHDAYEIYGQNPGFWEDAYKGDPNVPKNGPKMAPVSRTSRLPVAPADDQPSKGGCFWGGLFPGRATLREAQRKWRE